MKLNCKILAALPDKDWRPALFGALFIVYASATPALATVEKAGRYYEDALGRYERGDIAGTIIQLKNTLQEDNSMLAARLLLGKALLKKGDLKSAEAALEESLQQGVNIGEVAETLGQLYLALGKPQLVIERLPASGLVTPVQVDVLTMRGTAYAELGKLALARQSFAQAKALDPKSPVPLIAEVPVLLSSGQDEQAKLLAVQATEVAPRNAYAWNMYASVLHARLDLVGALTAYDKALTLEPKLVDARIARVGLLMDLKRNADAGKDLSYLASQAPQEPRAAYLRAVIASQAGDAKASAAALNEAAKEIDSLPSPWLARREQLLMVGALAHHGLGNGEKAREYLDIIIKQNSRHIGARKLLATLYFEKRDYPRAMSTLEALQKDIGNDPQVLYLLGSVHMALRHYQYASELLERAAARTPTARVNRSLALSQLGLGQNELARQNLEKAFAANPGDTHTAMALATIQMRNGDVRKAVQTADSIAKQDPGNLTALNFLGTVKSAAGDRAGARMTFTQVLSKDPAYAPAILNLAKLDASEKRYDDARNRLNSYLTKRRDAPEALFELGLLEYQAGRIPDALRALQKATEVQRRDTRAGLVLIDIYLAQKQPALALSTAKALLSRFPENLPVQLALGRAYLLVGDPASARNIFLAATRQAEFDPEQQVGIARLQLAASNPEGAFYNIQKALQGKPDDPAALALLVEIEARRGSAAKADEALALLRSKHPEHVLSALATAELAMMRGQFSAAAIAYNNALSREPSTGNALKLAQAYLSAGEGAKAVSFLETWQKQHPGEAQTLKALAEAQFRAGQLPAARQSYAKALVLEPDDAVSLNNYANLLLKLRDPAAQSQAEKALKLAPNNASYADTLGWILVQQGQYEAGLRYLREARLRSPENGEIRYHLAYALSKTGRKAEAKDEIGAALSVSGKIDRSEAVITLQRELGLL
ncbi:tetratricopeptide repeat protein [Chitinimonas naiadis]